MDREEKLEYQRDYQRKRMKDPIEKEKHYQRVRKYLKNKPHKQTATANRIKILDILGRVCVVCGFTDIRALQIDHIDSDGLQQIKEIGSMAKMYKFYVDNPDKIKIKLQTLCANCNWIKRYENKELDRKPI